MPSDPSYVNGSIRRALRDGAPAYAERGIIVVEHLDATARLDTVDPVLDEAIYTIFRGLPYRLSPGATLVVSTHDRAGGDIELLWEARELVDPGVVSEPLRQGPHADLLELALDGLATFCRARGAHEDHQPIGAGASNFLQLAPHVRRRYLFLIPTLSRVGRSGPVRRS